MESVSYIPKSEPAKNGQFSGHPGIAFDKSSGLLGEGHESSIPLAMGTVYIKAATVEHLGGDLWVDPRT